jgi:hypothetical protein
MAEKVPNPKFQMIRSAPASLSDACGHTLYVPRPLTLFPSILNRPFAIVAPFLGAWI